MKKILSFLIHATILSFIFQPAQSWSQTKNRASMEIILSDHGYLRINVNDREFDEVNKKIHLNDIPSGKIYLEVIKVCGSQSEVFCNQRVFYGYINLEKNKHYQAVVLVGEEEIIVSDKNNLFDKNLDLNAPSQNTVSESEILPAEIVMEHKNKLSGYWKGVYDTISKKESDNEKKKLINGAVKERKSIKAEELLPLLSTLLFDDSKEEVLKENYQYISDKQNISLLKYAFNLESNFNDVINTLR